MTVYPTETPILAVEMHAIGLPRFSVRLRLRPLGRHEVAVGDVVGFLDRDHQERSGTIERLNDKTVTLITQGQKWRVAYALLHRVVEIDAQEIHHAGLIKP